MKDQIKTIATENGILDLIGISKQSLFSDLLTIDIIELFQEWKTGINKESKILVEYLECYNKKASKYYTEKFLVSRQTFHNRKFKAMLNYINFMKLKGFNITNN